MKSSSKKSAIKWLLGGFTAFTLTISLAGCSQTAEESPELEKTTDASLTETAEYVPASADGPAQNVPTPTLSVDAAENSAAGAETALQFFWDAEEYARLTGLTDLISLVSSEDCEFCRESINGWRQSYEEGFWNVPKGRLQIEITEIDYAEDDKSEQSVAHIYFQLNEPATDYYNSQAELTDESFDAPEIKDWFALMHYDATAQRWEVDWLGLEENIQWED